MSSYYYAKGNNTNRFSSNSGSRSSRNGSNTKRNQENTHSRWVMPLIANMNSVNVSLITFASDIRYLPMDPTLFPTTFIRRRNPLSSYMSQGYWMLWMHERELSRSGYLNQSSKVPEREVEASSIEKVCLTVDYHEMIEGVDTQPQQLEREEIDEQVVPCVEDVAENTNIEENIKVVEKTSNVLKTAAQESEVVTYTRDKVKQLLVFLTKQLKEDSYRARLEEQERQLIEEEKKVFISTATDLGLDVFLELDGEAKWCSDQEMKAAYTFAKEIVSEAREHLSMMSLENRKVEYEDKDLIMLEKTIGDKRTAERGNLSTEEIESIALLCLYSSASMSPKLAAKQEDPILVRAAAKAIQDEKESLINNGVLEAIRWKDIPAESRNRILRGFIFVVNKFDADGTFLKAKARYVVNGKTQHDDTYGWTASPVVARPLVYMLLQKSLEWGNLKNMDVPKAFQIPDQEEELYLKTQEGELYRLAKALYGCKHSAWKFYILVRKILIQAGWRPTQYDGGTLTYVENGILIGIIALHVDDLLTTYKYKWVFDQLMKVMTESFGELAVGEGENFLGLRIERTADTINVSQPGYLERLGDQIDIQAEFDKYRKEVSRWERKTVPWTSQVPNEFTERDKEEESSVKVDRGKYMKLIGLLQYASQVRSDIYPVVGMLASRQNDPSHANWMQALRLAWYLRKTYKLGITFKRAERKDGQVNVWGSVDASYINGKGKSRIGITIALGANSTPILVMSKKQATGSGSSTEAELKGYNYCASIIEWIRNIMKYVYLENIGPSIIECDNKPSCLAIRKACVTPNLLHMNPKHWYCRMLYQRRQIIFAWVSTKVLLADALTKPLSEKDFLRYRARLLGEYNIVDLVRELTLPNEKKILTGEQDIIEI